MKRFLSLILAGALALGLTACGGSGGGSGGGNSGGSGASGGGDTKVLYHTYNTAPYVTLDPSTEYSNGIMVLQNVYETLTRYNPDTGDLDPMLATSWTKNDDGTV